MTQTLGSVVSSQHIGKRCTGYPGDADLQKTAPAHPITVSGRLSRGFNAKHSNIRSDWPVQCGNILRRTNKISCRTPLFNVFLGGAASMRLRMGGCSIHYSTRRRWYDWHRQKKKRVKRIAGGQIGSVRLRERALGLATGRPTDVST